HATITPSLSTLTCPPPTPTLFPYTTLFRSRQDRLARRPPGPVDPRLHRRREVRLDLLAGRDRQRHHRCLLWRQVELVGLLRLLRSEEHTSELQSQSNLVCRLLLEKKKKQTL